MRFKDKVAIVTGGASGIGAATALALAKEGAKVVVADINLKGLEKMDATMKKEGLPFFGIQANVAHEIEVEKIIHKTISQFGGIDLLVNNAGKAYLGLLK